MTVDHHWSPHQAEPAAAAPIGTASNVYFIDNYDSFTWNVYQYLILEGATVTVVRNDEISLDELIGKKPSQLIISPGPGHPLADSGISQDAIRYFSGKIPIWGVCMGHQCIIAAFGGIVESAGEFLHGKTSPLSHDSKGIYQGLAQRISITRYHSLAGNRSTLPACLEISSWVDRPDGSAGVIQGVRHKEYTIEGVQFHPESILTDGGRAMVRNFLRVQGGTWAENERLQKEAAAPGPTPAVPAEADKKNILQRIYAARRAAVEIQKTIPSQRPADLQAGYDLGAAPAQIDFISRLSRSPFDVALMAEIKRASPSKGVFDLDMDAPTQARRYALAGASVISVLTEPEWFRGSIDDLRAVRQVLGGMPNRPAILRKEFIFDEYQILEARLAGADTVLLIVKMLPPDLLARLCAYSRSLGMEPLVEVQNADEMTTATRVGARVVGVNNRNLESFEVDLGTTGRLRGMVSPDTVICALSGISTHQDVLMCKRDGINAILVGEAIMRAPDAGQFIRQLCAGPGAAAAAAPAPGEPDREPVAAARLLVKICGTRSAEAAAAAAREGADIVGIILSPQSGRCVSADVALAISAEIGRSTRVSPAPRIPDTVATDFFGTVAARLPSRRPLLAGVFQNQALSEVLEKQQAYGLDIVQLHGDEPAEWAALIPVPVFRAFKPAQAGIGARGYHALPVLDGGGGSGIKLDAAAVRSVLERDPGLSIILAGGLNPANVAEAVGSVGPGLANRIVGVDVSSGVEVDGEQSLERIGEFIRAARAIQ